jgi:hypothetical protein
MQFIEIDAISGHDPRDSTSISEKMEDFHETLRNFDGNMKGMVIGIPKVK